MRIYKKLLITCFVLFVALFFAAPWVGRDVRADGPVSLFLQPANGDIAIGGAGKAVALKITPNGRQVIAVQIELEYIYDDITIRGAEINGSLSGDLTEMAGSHDGIKKYALTFTTPITQDTTLATFNFKAVRSQPKANVDVLLGNAKVILANSDASLTTSNGGVSVQDAKYNLVTASASEAPPESPAAAVTTFTTRYRIAENPNGFTETGPNGWKGYPANGVTIDDVAALFPDFKTPGQKFIYVQFEGKDSAGNDVRTTLETCPKCQARIKVLGDPPSIAGCRLSFEGNNTILNLKADKDKGFGQDKGTVKSGNTTFTAEQIKSWKNDKVQVVWPNATEGQILPISLTNSDGQSNPDGQFCGSISALALGAKVFCRAPSNHQTDNVDLILADNSEGGKKIKQKVSIDKEGLIQGLTQKLEAGQYYTLSLKAPRSLRRTVPVKAEEGITNLSNFLLPVGDIFPADGGDGKINNIDRSELVRQWSLTADATGKSGDFNRDGRVNSVDWTCMKNDFNQSDDPEPAAGVQSSPSPGPIVSPSPSPSANAGEFCGGIAGVRCRSGFRCQLEGNFPDAGGRCVSDSN